MLECLYIKICFLFFLLSVGGLHLKCFWLSKPSCWQLSQWNTTLPLKFALNELNLISYICSYLLVLTLFFCRFLAGVGWQRLRHWSSLASSILTAFMTDLSRETLQALYNCTSRDQMDSWEFTSSTSFQWPALSTVYAPYCKNK